MKVPVRLGNPNHFHDTEKDYVPGPVEPVLHKSD